MNTWTGFPIPFIDFQVPSAHLEYSYFPSCHRQGYDPLAKGHKPPKICLVGITLSNSHPVQTSLYVVGNPPALPYKAKGNPNLDREYNVMRWNTLSVIS